MLQQRISIVFCMHAGSGCAGGGAAAGHRQQGAEQRPDLAAAAAAGHVCPAAQRAGHPCCAALPAPPLFPAVRRQGVLRHMSAIPESSLHLQEVFYYMYGCLSMDGVYFCPA
jgi:hypothetical protein